MILEGLRFGNNLLTPVDWMNCGDISPPNELMTPEEISRFFARNDQHKRQLVIWAGYNPMILQRIEYFDAKSPVHHVFKGKYADASA